MKLIFITDARYVRLANGAVYSLEGSFSYQLYLRYLNSFEEIIIIARVKQGNISEVNAANCVTQGKVIVCDLPYYVGLNDYMKKSFVLKKILKKYLKQYLSKDTAIICRIPGKIGAIAISYLRKWKIYYGIEVVGDPYDVFSKGAISHPLRPLLQVLAYRSLKYLCKNAPAALYVTKYSLQRRYPCPNFSVGVSDVVLPTSAFVTTPRHFTSHSPIKLICVGTLEQWYKAPDIVIKALNVLTKEGVKYHFTWVGDGRLRIKILELCKKYKIDDFCDFIGKVGSGSAVREKLDQADIFIMPSRTEGLPRALVEAMARALPCIATGVGGIPELLAPDVIIPIDDFQALANKIQYIINNPDFARVQSERNLAIAHNYNEDSLMQQRSEFYEYIVDLTK